VNDRLYRSVDDRVIAGVCSGIAERLDLDPTLVRIGYAMLALITGIVPFVILYVLMVVVVPEEPNWTGVRPIASDAWSSTDPRAWNSPAAGQWEPVAPVQPSTAGTPAATISTGVPPVADAVPGWAPPSGTPGWAPGGPAWDPGALGWDPGDRRGRRAAERAARHADRDARRAARRDDPTFAILAGIFLVGLGVFFLLRNAFAIEWNLIWPAIVVTLGVLLVIAALRPRRDKGK
jgi:phage shock protein C